MTNPKILCNCSLSGEPNYGPVLCEICDKYDDEFTEQLREKQFNERMAWDHAVDAIEEPYPNVVENNFVVEVIDIEDLEDGSANIKMNLSAPALRHFASIGLIKVIEDAAWETIEDKFLD